MSKIRLPKRSLHSEYNDCYIGKSERVW